MSTLFKMAWLNLWRNPRRTFILLCAMAAGLVGILFSISFVRGWTRQMREDAVGTYEGHIKILAAGYSDQPVVEHHMADAARLSEALEADPRVRGWVRRIVVPGLLATAEHSLVVTIIGTDPARERDVSTATRTLYDGQFLTAGGSGEMLIGRDLSEKIRKGVGRKVVVMAQQFGGEIGTSAYRVAGLYDSGNGPFNERHVYVTLAEARRLLNLEGGITEIAVMLNDIQMSPAVAADLRSRIRDPGIEILTWSQRMPFVRETLKMVDQFSWPYYAIFYIAMAFGVVNTMMMSIGERTHEIGVLRAVGMTRARLMGMIMLESLFIAGVATAAGLALGSGLVRGYAVRGIDLSAFSEGLEQFGMAHVIRPALQADDTAWACAGTFAVSLLFSLLPAWRASRLAPVEALRKTG